jgi:hypothetical protein
MNQNYQLNPYSSLTTQKGIMLDPSKFQTQWEVDMQEIISTLDKSHTIINACNIFQELENDGTLYYLNLK